MPTRYLIVEPEWFFNDEFWGPFADGWGSARQQFTTKEAAEEQARQLNRESLRRGRTPLPSWCESAEDEALMKRLREILSLKEGEEPTWKNLELRHFEKIGDAELDEIIDLFGHAYYHVRAFEEPPNVDDRSWHLVVECYPAFDGGGTILPAPSDDHEAFEKVLSLQPTRAAAEEMAMAFNRKTLIREDQTLLAALGNDSFSEHTAEVLKILSLPAMSDPTAIRFSANGTLSMVRQLAKLLVFQYQDIRECPGQGALA